MRSALHQPNYHNSGHTLNPHNSRTILRSVKMATHRNYREYFLKSLQDPQESAAYLEAFLDDSDEVEFFSALMDVTEAQAIVLTMQQELVLHSQLKTFFTQPSTPDFTGLLKILDPIGLNLSVPV